LLRNFIAETGIGEWGPKVFWKLLRNFIAETGTVEWNPKVFWKLLELKEHLHAFRTDAENIG